MTEENKYWIALYTHPRHELSVARQLAQHGIECYVPMRREVHQWSDRRKWIESPLIPSYVFACVPLRQYSRVYDAHGIVRVVMFRHRIAIIRPSEIELLRRVTQVESAVVVSSEVYHTHDEVEIINGVFSGYHGRVVHANKVYTLSIRIEELDMSIFVEVPRIQVRAIVHDEVTV